jgi:hypothetical protein
MEARKWLEEFLDVASADGQEKPQGLACTPALVMLKSNDVFLW